MICLSVLYLTNIKSVLLLPMNETPSSADVQRAKETILRALHDVEQVINNTKNDLAGDFVSHTTLDVPSICNHLSVASLELFSKINKWKDLYRGQYKV